MMVYILVQILVPLDQEQLMDPMELVDPMVQVVVLDPMGMPTDPMGMRMVQVVVLVQMGMRMMLLEVAVNILSYVMVHLLQLDLLGVLIMIMQELL